MDLHAWFTRKFFYPLWALKNRSPKIREWRSLERSQWLSAAELRSRQWDSAGRLIEYAYAHCPSYRARLARANVSSREDVTPQSWLRVPILTKGDIRMEDGLRSDLFRTKDLVEAKTGGSTGIALRIFLDRRCQERRNAAAWRADRWAGWRLGMRLICIWGNPPEARSLVARLRRVLHDRVDFVDTMSIDEKSLTQFLSLCRKGGPYALVGHSHSLFIVARWVEKRGERLPRPSGIIATSMMLLDAERDTIERAFGTRVTNRYGCEEVGLIACECEEHLGMHLNAEHLIVESLRDDGTPAEPGEEGTLVLTDLLNRGMPLIRYRIEDVGVLSNRVCPCGRGLPLLERLTGRTADFLVRSDGSLVAGVSLVERTLTAIPEVEQLQIIQETIGAFRLKLVPAEGYGPNAGNALAQRLREVFGEESLIEIELVERIAQDPSGKFRFAICRVGY